MTPQELLPLLHRAEKLKCATRHSWTSDGRHESVAEHSWRLTLMAMLMRSEYPGTDMDRVIRMCVIHDLGEAFTGDIPAFEKTAGDEETERRVLYDWVGSFPEPERSEWLSLYREMDALETPEAKLYKALDKLEAVLQHDEADISTWLPLEYDLQKTYGAAHSAFSPYTRSLKSAIDELTDRKIRESQSSEE